MRTQPTSGPWRAKTIGSFNEPGYAVFWEDRSKSGVHTRRLDYKGCFTEADGRLIAAAPDMYEALKSLTRDCEIANTRWVDQVGIGAIDINALSHARAAIAKAEGKS